MKPNQNLADIYNYLGSTFNEIYDFENAKRYYLMALETNQLISGKDCFECAIIYNNLGYLSLNNSQNREAEIYYLKAIDIYENLGRTTSADYMLSKSNLGQNYIKMGK